MKKFKIFINYAISISLMIIPAFLTQDYLFNALKYIDNSSIAYLISFLGYLLFLLIGIFINTIIHESGHLVAGLISGYKFSSFRILSTCFVKDGDKVKDYAREAVSALSREKIINGYDGGTFKPNETASRAETAVMIYRMKNLIK